LYELKVDAINLNLYSTGVGFLSFFLKNEEVLQSQPDDILKINQYGRRIMPPFFVDISNRSETAEYIQITGLYGHELKYKETFDTYSHNDFWKPASFVRNLIIDLTTNISIEPIIDDRMFVVTWYKNNELTKVYQDDLCSFLNGDDKKTTRNYFWYRFLFMDKDDPTCQNKRMRADILKKHTYTRWQKWGSLYGVSKYSMAYLTDSSAQDFLIKNYQTIYARMVELVLVQRASILRFSSEVTKISSLSNKKANTISERISSIYKEYIRFVNQIYFREVTAQDQGIELYDLMSKTLKTKEYVEDLDKEIGELYQYVSLMEDKERNRNAGWLNTIATILLPATLVTGLFGMNYGGCNDIVKSFWVQVAFVVIITIIIVVICFNIKSQRKGNKL
jgi:Mg2+ and Co2+ transporter CorA